MTKTPFEVRLDLLAMAKDMLEIEYGTKSQIYMEQLKGNDGVAPINSELPSYYTTADVITKANELYSFVNDRSSTGIKKKD